VNRGWWRRNVWGLLLVVPLAAGLFVSNAGEFYRRNYTHLPKEPVAVDGTGRAAIDDRAVRVVEITSVDGPEDIERLVGFGPDLPSGVRIWRVIVALEGTDKDRVSDCEATLLDADGRAWEPDPAELHGTFKNSIFMCWPDDDEQPSPYLSTMYFLLPAEARPATLRIFWDDRLPRYIRFPVP
jgi:hypothetical protein